MAFKSGEVTTVDVKVERFKRIPITVLSKKLEIVNFSENVSLNLFST